MEPESDKSCWNEMNVSPNDKRGGRSGGNPAGILRFEIGRIRRPSMELLDLRFLHQREPPSPQPSVDRLSVTFAADESLKSDGSARWNSSLNQQADKSPKSMDKVRFPSRSDEENSEEEDYSASVTAIMQRRASTRRSKKRSGGRRASSPFSPDIVPGTENGRRRSSVFTTSSGDTGITIEDSFTPSVTQEQIFENIRLHKEVLSSVKMQPWNMRKKLRLVLQAKNYIKRHEGALQERLAQSHSTRDMLASLNIYLIKKWQHYKREAANMSNWLIPWELRIKEIESHFGSVVASYFIFLRWLFWVNMVVSSILLAFVAIPEMLAADYKKVPERKSILQEDKYNSTNFLTLWDFEGVFKYSPMFYGWYTNIDSNSNGYRLPLAYFFTELVVYVYSFVATLRKMAKNSRMSKLSEKEDECIFSWKLFTGWDYMIGNAETAHNRVASIVMSFKEALLEEAEKKREAQNWKIFGSRILVNLGVLGLLALSAFAVVKVVERSNEKEASSTTWRRNEITVVMSLISLFFPILFELLGYFEHYHPRKQLRLQLARIMVLNLLNLYSLMFALFGKIEKMTNDLESYKPPGEITTDNTLIKLSTQVSIYQPEANATNCYKLCAPAEMQAANLVATLIADLSLKILSKISPANISLDALGTSASFTNFTEDFDLTSNITNFINLNPNETYSTPIYNGTDYETSTNDSNFDLSYEALSEFWKNLFLLPDNNETFTNYEETTPASLELFKSTLSPLFINASVDDYDARIDSIYDEYTTAMTNLQAPDDCKIICDPIDFNPPTLNDTIEIVKAADYKSRSRLRSLCWETMFGQELVKLTIMDLVLTVLSTLAIDFLRGMFVRFMNSCWCWDLEKKFPQYGDFKVAENILHLVNNQGMVWMGMFFSPGLVVLNLFKLYIMMYLRSWAVLTCNVPHEVIFRASRSNNFYFALLLMMLFLCVLPVGYTIVWLEPSWHCGPFSSSNPKRRIFHIFTETIKGVLPVSMHNILDYIASPGIVIPLLVLLVLIIYYLLSLTSALREANNDLKIQLRRERTEERRKMFQIADRRRRGGSEGSNELGNTPFGKWKKLLQGLPPGKSYDETTKQESIEEAPNQVVEVPPEIKNETGKGILSKFIFRTLKTRKQTDEDNPAQQQDDGTDTEQHDSLPDDAASVKEAKQQVPKKSEATGFIKTKNATPKLESVRKKPSVESETKHVQIKEALATGAFQKRRDVFEKKKKHTKENRQDSNTSNWSDNIPVITISKTESSECILETKNDIKIIDTKNTQDSKRIIDTTSTKYFTKSNQTEISKNVDTQSEHKPTKISKEIDKTHSKRNNNEPGVHTIKESKGNITQSASENSERKSKSPSRLERDIPIDVEEDDEFKPQIKYVLKKQVTHIEKDDEKAGTSKAAKRQYKNSGTDSTQTTDTTKTESSSDYRDNTISN